MPIRFRVLISKVDQRLCVIYLADPVSGGYNDERNKSDLSLQMSSSRMKHIRSLFPEAESATSGCDEKVNLVSNDLLDCCLTGQSMFEAELAKRSLTLSGYNHGVAEIRACV